MVLVNFWASWDGPSRIENSNIVLAYNKYKNEKFKNANGFEVYSISLDNQKWKWEAAIKKDNLYWPIQVSELQYWNDKTTKVYGVKHIPYNFLIDGDGNILASGITGWILDKNGKNTNVSKLDNELKKYLISPTQIK